MLGVHCKDKRADAVVFDDGYGGYQRRVHASEKKSARGGTGH